MSRHLKNGEKIILIKLVPELLKDIILERVLVTDMNDGGMGSVIFDSPKMNRLFGAEVAVGWYFDSDRVPVSVAVNVDKGGELFEIDSYKTDSTPLIRLPQSGSEITLGLI